MRTWACVLLIGFGYLSFTFSEVGESGSLRFRALGVGVSRRRRARGSGAHLSSAGISAPWPRQERSPCPRPCAAEAQTKLPFHACQRRRGTTVHSAPGLLAALIDYISLYNIYVCIHAPRARTGCGCSGAERCAEPPGSGRPRGARRCTQPAAGTVSAAGRSWLNTSPEKPPFPGF